MQQATVLNSAINSNRSMYQQMKQPSVASNKAHLVNAYYGDKTQYYNDEVALKKEQKKKIGKISTILFASLATIGIIGNTYYQIARKHVNFGTLTQNAKSTLDKAVHFFMNMDMAKNNLWKDCSHIISTKTPINTEKWLDEPIEKLYSGLGKFFNNKKYEKGVKTLQENATALKLEDLPQSGAYSKWFDEHGKIISERINTSNEHAKNAFTDAYKIFKDNKGEISFFERLKKSLNALWKNGSSEIIEDKYLSDLYTSQTTSQTEKYLRNLNLDDEKIALLSSDSVADIFKRNKAKKELISDIAKKLEGKCENPEKAAKKVANSLLDIHKITSSGAREVLEKQRDIRLGNNSVEFLGNVATVGTLGIAIACSDSKEQKKSKILNLGIPLVTALGFSSIGGVLNISGAKAAIIGLLTGQAASLGAKKLEENIKKKVLEEA